MSVLSSCCSSFAALSRAAAKHASSRLRRMGLLSLRVDWAARAEVCERCPLRVIHKKISYCGKPFLQQVDRDPTVDGCGCPVRAKARDPGEHCPLTPRHLPATTLDGTCDCKWCASPLAASQGR
jgi:hypothetical protein